MPDVRLIDANAIDVNDISCFYSDECRLDDVQDLIDSQPTVDAQPVKRGHWSECYRDSRCISVICSVCKNPTVISHGCRDADEVTMDDVIERLPHCPKCCSDMRGDADER
jgi:hypothetical protein